MTENSLRTRIQEEMKDAMRAKAVERLSTIRMLIAAIKQREIDERITLNEPQILATIDKLIKQRQESVAQYQQGGRADLVAKESAEIEVLKEYLPEQLTEEEVNELIQDAIDEVNAESIKDMAKVMAIIKPKAQGRTDIGTIGAKVKAILSAL